MKNVNLSISLPAIKKSFSNFLYRFHVTTFVIVVLGGLVVVVLLLNDTIVTSGEANGYTSQTTITTFDQATMKRIEELKTRDQTTDITAQPGVRINPFVE